MRVIGGKAKGRILKFPKLSKKNKIRPLTDRTREALFNILASNINGCRFLDLFAGTGAVGIEALSRGAAFAFFVEQDRKAVAVIRENLEITCFSDQSEVYSIDVLKAVGLFDSKKAEFDIIFIGAPYDDPVLENTLKALSNSALINNDSIVIAEHRNIHDLPDNYGRLMKKREAKYGDTKLSFYKLGDI